MERDWFVSAIQNPAHFNFWTQRCAAVAVLGRRRTCGTYPYGLLSSSSLLEGGGFTPPVAQCPVCQQMVRLHVDKAGRRHVFAHARDLYEGSRISVHYAAKFKCIGSGSRKLFDPRPKERQRFKLPNSLLEQ